MGWSSSFIPFNYLIGQRISKLKHSIGTNTPINALQYFGTCLDFFIHLKGFTSPLKWLIRLNLLSLYSKTSNTKINLSKTVIVSLSRKTHEDWRDLAGDATNTQWFDKPSNDSVRYLGVSTLSYARVTELLPELNKSENSVTL